MMRVVLERLSMAKYAVYKQSGVSWIGDIPTHWVVKPGFAVVEERFEKNSGLVEKVVLSLSYGKIIVRPEEKLTGLVPESFETYQLVYPGDIIIRPTDLQNDKTSLRTGLAKYKGIITSAYINLKVKDGYSATFYHYFLHAADITKVIYGLGTGLRQNLGIGEFQRLKFLVPPKSEQTRIAQFLNRKTAQIDKAIAQKEKLIELLEERRQILIHKAVTRGLNPNVKMKDSGVEWIGEVPEHWEVKRLKYISHVQSGLTLGKPYIGKDTPRFPYLRVANVQAGYFKLDEIAEISIPTKDANKYLIKTGDILVTEGGDLDKLGRGTVWRGEIKNCLHQNHIFAIRVDRSIISPEFASLTLGSDYGRKYFTNTANKTTNLASTNSTKLGNFPVMVPPLNDQFSIVENLAILSRKISYCISLTENEIKKLKEYKTTLINSAVTGRIKV